MPGKTRGSHFDKESDYDPFLAEMQENLADIFIVAATEVLQFQCKVEIDPIIMLGCLLTVLTSMMPNKARHGSNAGEFKSSHFFQEWAERLTSLIMQNHTVPLKRWEDDRTTNFTIV